MHQSKGQSQFHDLKLLSHLSLTYDMRYQEKNGKKFDLKFGLTDHDLPYYNTYWSLLVSYVLLLCLITNYIRIVRVLVHLRTTVTSTIKWDVSLYILQSSIGGIDVVTKSCSCFQHS